MTYKLSLPMQQSGYGFSEISSGIETNTKGGFARRSADLEDASLLVNVTWKVSEANYTYLQDFFAIATNNGKTSFLIDLVIDDASLVEYTANFLNELKLTKIVGFNYFVSATLEVTPLLIDEDFDNAIVAVNNASYFDPETLCNLLNQIVNINWPEA